MFFVTLLLSAVETWMRTQSGSTSLRALVYFDELYGYLPPTAMPPSKTPLLRMLKQARAFGVGMVLATQNPVDVDYKALSNAGTWFVGKLQTERDKNRLLDGLQSASADLDRNAYSDIISALGKRIFLMHNIHSNGAILFHTRWTMNFLAGPLTRPQIPALNRLAGALMEQVPAVVAEQNSDLSQFQPISASEENSAMGAARLPDNKPAAQSTFRVGSSTSQDGTRTKPVIPTGIAEYFFPLNYSMTEAYRFANKELPALQSDSNLAAVLYRPTLMASASVRFTDRRYGLDSEIIRDALIENLDRRGTVRWEDFPYDGPAMEKLESNPAPQAKFVIPSAPFLDIKLINALQKEFTDWVYRTSFATARANNLLKIFAGPDVSPAEFRTACANAARRGRDVEVSRVVGAIDRQLTVLQEKLNREERKLDRNQIEYENRRSEENGNMLELGAGFLGIGRKKTLTSQISKNRLSQQARAEVDASLASVDFLKQQIEEKQASRVEIIESANQRWAAMVNDFSELQIRPKKNDVYVQVFGVAWRPFYLVESGQEIIELPAFGRQ
jgi:hypothetical protein